MPGLSPALPLLGAIPSSRSNFKPRTQLGYLLGLPGRRILVERVARAVGSQPATSENPRLLIPVHLAPFWLGHTQIAFTMWMGPVIGRTAAMEVIGR